MPNQNLMQVDGELKISAKILIGYIYAEGSENIEPNRSTAESLFIESSRSLRKEFDELTVLGQKLKSLNEQGIKSYMRRSIQARKDYNFLCGYTNEYKIT